MFKCVLFYFVYILSICAETPDVIIQIYEEKAVGDKNQIIGVVNTFKKYKSGIDIVDYPCKSDTDPSVIANKIIKLKISNPSKKYLVIGVGNTAFAVFDRLSSKTDSHIQTLALGHQWMPGYDALIDKVTFIAVPEYSMEKPPKNMTKTIIILTNGVSHAATHASLLKEYEEYNNTLPLTPNDRVVILGGDAPNAANEIQLFNEEDVKKLAAGLISNSPDGKIYIINGPRTGKHDLENGTHKDNKIDKITNMFINILKSKGISEDRIKLFNFQFGEKASIFPL